MAFFEQLGKHLMDAGQNVKQQTKNFADVSQLNTAISAKEKRVMALYAELGRAYYDKYREDAAAEGQEQLAEITALLAEIEEAQEKIKRIRGIEKCPQCGGDVPRQASFCAACGAKMEREAAAEKEGRFCAACGAQVAEGNSFCSKCGAKMPEA